MIMMMLIILAEPQVAQCSGVECALRALAAHPREARVFIYIYIYIHTCIMCIYIYIYICICKYMY